MILIFGNPVIVFLRKWINRSGTVRNKIEQHLHAFGMSGFDKYFGFIHATVTRVNHCLVDRFINIVAGMLEDRKEPDRVKSHAGKLIELICILSKRQFVPVTGIHCSIRMSGIDGDNSFFRRGVIRHMISELSPEF